MRKICLYSSLIILTSLITFCSSENSQKSKEEDAAGWAEKTLAGLSLEKKVAQLICTDITGVYLPDDDTLFKKWIKYAGEYGIGGFVIYSGTPYNVAKVLNKLQKEAEIPILISSDFEGGPGQQVTGASEFPGNLGFAATRDESLMYEAAKAMAAEGRAMGIHLSYTPVSDISISPDNPQESVRSFGGDIELNGKLLKAYVRGYSEMGMINTAKHFPGRGDMRAYPAHPGFTYLNKSAEELEENEFRAFKYAIDAGVEYIMTEHIAVPSITGGSELPASVEPKLVKGIIREKLGFKGIITTDDLWYAHVIARFGEEELPIKALEAGHDILLKPKDPVATISSVVKAVKSGKISEAQINESVYKLLYQKALLGLHKNRFVDEGQVGMAVGNSAHKELVNKVADKSMTLLKNVGLLPIRMENFKKIVHITIQKDATVQPAAELLNSRITTSFNGVTNYRLKPDTGDQYLSKLENDSKTADLVILSFFVTRDRNGDTSPLSQKDLEIVKRIIAVKPNAVIAMSYGNPFIINKIENVPVFITGYGEGGWYGNQAVYFDSFIRLLKGKISPSGKLPVQINDKYPIGSGLVY